MSLAQVGLEGAIGAGKILLLDIEALFIIRVVGEGESNLTRYAAVQIKNQHEYQDGVEGYQLGLIRDALYASCHRGHGQP